MFRTITQWAKQQWEENENPAMKSTRENLKKDIEQYNSEISDLKKRVSSLVSSSHETDKESHAKRWDEIRHLNCLLDLRRKCRAEVVGNLKAIEPPNTLAILFQMVREGLRPAR